MMDNFFQQSFFRLKILEWASLNFRKYPWRDNRNTYRVLISEIFLQRTKADQVEDIYHEFIHKYPNEESFFSISKIELKKLFNSLGLMKRMQYLLNIIKIIEKSAKKIEDFSDKELNALPGVGKYSLNAVKCFGRGKKVPIVDSNIIRIFKRFFGIESSRSQPRNDPEIWALAEKLLPVENYVEYNYALIDFGALVCKYSTPDCNSCILGQECKYKQDCFT